MTTKDSIYKIITASGTGTGFKVSGYDFVITNYHVVKGSKVLAVEDNNQDRFLGHVIMVNPEVDLAFIQVEGLMDKPSPIQLDETMLIESRDKVYINGFPFGMPFTVTEGIVSSPNQPMHGRNYLQTDAAVNPGNSGGPMLNENNVLMGVTTSKFTEADNVGFGIQHTDVIKQIKDYTFTDVKYRVKCNSCDHFTEEETEFCPNCGNNIDISVFEEFEKSHFANFTEEALSDLGINPILCRAGSDYWEFHQGSARVRIFTVNNNNYLFATSPLNILPKDNLKALLRYLTSTDMSPYQFGIYENKIYISYRTHLSDIYSDKKDEIKKNVTNLALKADELDDFFHNTYGCDMSMESKKQDEEAVIQIQQVAQQEQVVEDNNNHAIQTEVEDNKTTSKAIFTSGDLFSLIDPMKDAMQNVTALMSKYDEFEEVDFNEMQEDIDQMYEDMKRHRKVDGNLITVLKDISYKEVYEDFFVSYKAVLKDMKRMIQSKDLLHNNWTERIEANVIIYEKMLELYSDFKKQ